MEIIDLVKGRGLDDLVSVPTGGPFSDKQDLLSTVQPFVATVGFFDGVHVGHRHLIEQVKGGAAQGTSFRGGHFPGASAEVLQSDYRPLLLNEFDEKVSLLASTGVDYCISLPFTEALSGFQPGISCAVYLNEPFGWIPFSWGTTIGLVAIG